MKHPDWPAFLAAILAEPNDNTLRLVAADFLEENGAPDRAAFIRVQIALLGRNGAREVEELRRREREYLDPRSAYAPAWAAEECPELVRGAPAAGAVIERLVWRRGFVERAYCSASEWLQHGAAIRSRNPVRQVALRLNVGLDRDHWSAGLPALRGLASVDLYQRFKLPEAAFIDWLREVLPGTQVTVTG